MPTYSEQHTKEAIGACLVLHPDQNNFGVAGGLSVLDRRYSNRVYRSTCPKS